MKEVSKPVYIAVVCAFALPLLLLLAKRAYQHRAARLADGGGKKASTASRMVPAILGGIALYGVFVVVSGLDEIREALRTFHWGMVPLALALAMGNYLLRFLKWEFYLKQLEIKGIPKLESLLIFWSGFVLTITPGKVGEIFKSSVLEQRHGVPLARTAPIVIAERLTDVIGIVVLIAIGSLGFRGGLLWAGLGTLAVVVLLATVLSPRLSYAIIDRLEAIGPLRRIGPKLRIAYGALSLLVSPKNLGFPAVISLLAWLCECLSLWCIVRGFLSAPPVAPCIFFYAASTLAGALVPVPGGLGVTEAILKGQLMALGGASSAVATASMLLVRFCTLWFAVLVGLLAYVSLQLIPIKRTR
jgi:glycosyltransferase 2 family protein